ncbi:MAG: RNA polymerase sigma factor [Clostridia bacterium]|nr:RNA polymerase sigma factor [Clostridia bacterium]
MEDQNIIELFFERSENAVRAAAEKYGSDCESIAYSILGDHEIAKECVNDTYLRLWNAIPPHRPENLMAFMGKITRNLALDRYKRDHSKKRGGTQLELALEELEICASASDNPEESFDAQLLGEIIERFLAEQSVRDRKVFLRRYYLLSSIRDIAQREAVSEERVKSILYRLRKKLEKRLREEEIIE